MEPHTEVFVARQPLLDAQLRVQGYELLFRDGHHDAFPVGTSDSQATSDVVAAAFWTLSSTEVTGGLPAFVNVPQELLEQEIATVLPPGVVVEILETVEATPAVLAACATLRRRGHRLALDDVTGPELDGPLVALVDIVKVDVRATGVGGARQIARRLRHRDVTLLAEKVETHQEFHDLREVGYELFQGYFFARPQLLHGRAIPQQVLSMNRLLRCLQAPELDLLELEAVVGAEVSLSYKLLRFLNSASVGLRHPVHSLRHAFVMLGERELRKWLGLAATARVLDGGPTVLLAASVTRSRLCEQLAHDSGLELGAQPFWLGLFSLLDAILGLPMPALLTELALDPEVAAALRGEPGPLRDLLDLAVAYERGDWSELAVRRARLGLPASSLPSAYRCALSVGDEVATGELVAA